MPDYYKKTKEEHEVKRLVNDEVRDQFPKKVMKTTLWKKQNRCENFMIFFVI